MKEPTNRWPFYVIIRKLLVKNWCKVWLKRSSTFKHKSSTLSNLKNIKCCWLKKARMTRNQ